MVCVGVVSDRGSVLRLLRFAGVDGVDYVNASLVSSSLFSFPCRSYIAAQAPLSAYVSDFWHLLWERRVTLLVMLTREKERWKDDALVRKADRYWPEEGEGEVTIGELTVECQHTQQESEGLIVRRFRVRSNGQGKAEEDADAPAARMLVQLHFVGWPDHGVPPHIPDFAAFVERYRSMRDAEGLPSSSHDLPPIAVHCSAGIGRTGTFIAIDVLLDEVRHLRQRRMRDGGVSPLNIVRLLRTSRPGMVQTKGQYQLIYQLLDHHLARPQQQQMEGEEKEEEESRDNSIATATATDTATATATATASAAPNG